MTQKHEFKTEVRQLLNLMIHSLYSNRDIFLRELVANAADAIDKARFESLTKPELAKEWAINLELDKEHNILTIRDNGIGMTEEEVIQNIGTIAQSGTKAFLTQLEAADDKSNIPELIGQFGVGFYSAFMVADKVELSTKKAGSDAPAVFWTSKGEGEFELDTIDKADAGTEIKLHLKEDAKQYLETWKISEIVRKYSDFIAYPIILPYVTVNEDKTETVELKTLNSQKAIWLRKPSEITEEEYKSFYSHLSHYPGSEYAKAIHMSAEGNNEFKALLFLPKNAPFNLLMPEFQKKGLQLYVKRVFISDECKELIPDYLRFVHGVVDSSDLPLNVSREILQENPVLGRIQKAVTSKIIGELKKMQENEPEAYAHFFHEFGRMLKEGLHSDFANVEKLKDVVMYESMNNEPGKLISLAQYVSSMPESQKDIYYITGEKREHLAANPALEYFKSKGFDVIFMTDPIDDWVMQSMFQYQKKHFKSVAKGDFELDGDEKTASETAIKEAGEKYAKLVGYIQTALADKVGSVRFSTRLTDSPCCLITDGGGMSPHMERLFKAMHQEVPETKRILELNPKHPLIEAFSGLFAADENSPELKNYVNVLYDQALLIEGSPLPDPAQFAKQITQLMLKGIVK